MDYLKIVKRLSKKPRIAGSSFGKKIKDYIISEFEKCGLDVEVQSSKFMGWDLIEWPKIKFIKPRKKKVRAIPIVWSGSTRGKVRGKLIPAGEMLTFEAYPFKKYSIVKGGEVGFILTRPDMVWLQSLNDATITTPCALVDTKTCAQIEKWQKDGKDIEVEFSVKTKYKPTSVLSNVVGTLKGSKENAIIVCAHYDSMFGSPGANDNGSGVVALLDLAGKLSKKKFKNTVKFIAFDAEEWNKLGAYTYVKGLKEKVLSLKFAGPSIKAKVVKVKKHTELEKVKFVINMDTVGAGDSIYGIVSKKYGKLVDMAIGETKILKRYKVEITKGYRAPQFDAWPFHKKGIPIIHFGCKPYAFFHTPQDTWEKIDPAMIGQVVKIVEKIVERLDKRIRG